MDTTVSPRVAHPAGSSAPRLSCAARGFLWALGTTVLAATASAFLPGHHTPPLGLPGLATAAAALAFPLLWWAMAAVEARL